MESPVGKTVYHQEEFKMQRLHELFLRADRFSSNPSEFNPEMNAYNYEIIANDYTSIFVNISSKLESEEKEGLQEIKKLLDYHILEKPMMKQKKIAGSYGYKSIPYVDKKNLYDIKLLLFQFRMKLEDYIEKYKFEGLN